MSLTFDDGPTYGNSSTDIARIFENKNMKTTFFLNGWNYRCIYEKAEEIQRAFGAGHQIGYVLLSLLCYVFEKLYGNFRGFVTRC